MKGIEITKTVHDADCPVCDFPETVIIRNAKTMMPLYEECGKKTCEWARKFPWPASPSRAKSIKLKSKK